MSKKHEEDEQKRQATDNPDKQAKTEPDRHIQEIEGRKQAKEAEKDSVYGETPEPGSLDPGKTTMANPPPQNVVIPPAEPTDDPMSTPAAAPLPNPPSRPGGDFAGEPNVSPTGEKLDPGHPDYRKDMEGQHQPDHRSAEEKKAFPRE